MDQEVVQAEEIPVQGSMAIRVDITIKVIKVVKVAIIIRAINSGQYHVFTTSLDKRDQKLHKRVVNVVEPAVPRYLRWSEQPILWSRDDHPPRVDNPGHLALVLAPQVGGYKF